MRITVDIDAELMGKMVKATGERTKRREEAT